MSEFEYKSKPNPKEPEMIDPKGAIIELFTNPNKSRRKAKMVEEDEIFAGERLKFRLGEVALTSRHDAENADWEETPQRSRNGRP